MRAFASWGLSLSIATYGLLHFITYFYTHSYLLSILSISGIGIMAFSIIILSVKKLKMPLSLLIVGFAVLYYSGTPIMEGIHKGFLEMRNMVGLLIVVPLISWVLREEPYIEAIVGYGNKLLITSRKFYFGIISFTQVVAYFLLFGSIQIVYHFVDEVLKKKKGEAWENFKGTALLRGFALSTMWVISIPSFVFVVEVMDASLIISILQGFGMSIIGIFIALIFSHFEEKKYGVDLTAGLESEFAEVMRSNKYNDKYMKQDFIEFVILFFTLFGSIFIIQAFVDIELLVLIPLAVISWIFIYYMYKKRVYKLWKQVKEHVKDDIIYESYQLCVMLGAGMMIFSLIQTDFASMVVDGIYGLQATIPFINLLYFLPFIVIVLGFFGLGPLTVMALVGGILGSLNLPYPPEIIVLTVTSGSAISILLSPLIMSVITLSGANGLNGFKNGIGFNWKYAIALYVVVQVYVQLMIA
ncbi:hypothetical protein CWR48_13480 [Oceanobacillus arenosus]|uniref:Permease n=1 Tax=Oceanobacillus arenosus TaxID=1229153 RepID=A0A3D8PPE1_9BACI|nr:hypothetical protein [Oceanobacillus arenosus]RDW17532.1 hypothetical protein CWR48_13480 [Oceanobacillus arenosus]